MVYYKKRSYRSRGRRYGRSLARRAFNYARYIAKTRPKPELKRIQKYIGDYTFPIDFGPYAGGTSYNYFSISLFKDIVKGDNSYERNGDEIFVKWIDFQVAIYAPQHDYDPDARSGRLVNYAPVTCMLVRFPDSVDIHGAGPPVAGSILEHPFYASISRLVTMQDAEFQREYVVEKKKTYLLGGHYPGYVNFTTDEPNLRPFSSSDYKPWKAFRWRVPINKVVTYIENSVYPVANECGFYVGSDSPEIDYVQHENFNFQLLTYVIYFEDK